MTIEEALFAYLSTHPLVLERLSTRIYPGKLPQKPTYPATRYRVVSNQQIMAHDGPGDLITNRIQFDCYGTGYLETKRVANTLRRVLNGFKGVMGSVRVDGVFFLNEVDNFGDASEAHRVAIDFKFVYKEN